MPKISVIIPVFNSASYIKETLCSIIEQTLRDIEIICIDDGSTDDSKKIIYDFMQKDSRIQYYFQENQGAGKARNLGIEKSSGEFIAFMDSDDAYPQSNTLETLYKKAKENNVSICGGSIFEGTITNNYRQFEREGFYSFDEYQSDFWFTRYIYDRRLLMDNNIRFPALRVYEDPVFLLDAMIAAKKFYAICEPVYQRQECHTATKPMSLRQQKDYLSGLISNLRRSKERGYKITYTNNVLRFRNFCKTCDMLSLCEMDDEFDQLYNNLMSEINWKSANRAIRRRNRAKKRNKTIKSMLRKLLGDKINLRAKNAYHRKED